MGALPLKSILTTDVVTRGSQATVGEVLHAMARDRISCVVVVDDDRRPRGIFTERDAVALLAAERLAVGDSIAEAMSSPVLTVPVAIDMLEAHACMQRQSVRHLVAVDELGKVAGVISEFSRKLPLATMRVSGALFGKPRSSRMFSISRPTFPVAPATATLKPIAINLLSLSA